MAALDVSVSKGAVLTAQLAGTASAASDRWPPDSSALARFCRLSKARRRCDSRTPWRSNDGNRWKFEEESAVVRLREIGSCYDSPPSAYPAPARTHERAWRRRGRGIDPWGDRRDDQPSCLDSPRALCSGTSGMERNNSGDMDTIMSCPASSSSSRPVALSRGLAEGVADAQNLHDHKIKSVVALAHPADDYLVVRERTLAEELGISWIHLPIVDLRGRGPHPRRRAPTGSSRRRPSSPIPSQPVYFHCHHGLNRASMAQIAYRTKYCGWSPRGGHGRGRADGRPGQGEPRTGLSAHGLVLRKQGPSPPKSALRGLIGFAGQAHRCRRSADRFNEAIRLHPREAHAACNGYPQTVITTAWMPALRCGSGVRTRDRSSQFTARRLRLLNRSCTMSGAGTRTNFVLGPKNCHNCHGLCCDWSYV